MKRPSRAKRESATTILKNGRFLAPPRASRITTMTSILKSAKRAILRRLFRDLQGKFGPAKRPRQARYGVASAGLEGLQPSRPEGYFPASPGFPEWNT